MLPNLPAYVISYFYKASSYVFQLNLTLVTSYAVCKISLKAPPLAAAFRKLPTLLLEHNAGSNNEDMQLDAANE